MCEILLSQFNTLFAGNTALVASATDSSAVAKIATIHFLQTSTMQINPSLHVHNVNLDIITYVVMALLAVISIVWYLLQDRFLTIFTLKSISRLQRESDSASKSPGLLVTGLFWVNFIISLSIFIFLILQSFFKDKIDGVTDYTIFIYILTTILILFLYKLLITFGAGFIFQTQKIMKQQIIIGRNIHHITGVILLPIILLLLYSLQDVLMYIVISIFILLQVYRLAQIVIIGKSSTVFSTLHIILYLCTLEIVPVLVLLRLINNDSGI